MPDGRVVKHEIRNDPTPTAHQTCLLFLNFEPEISGFSYRKFWVIEKDHLKPVYLDDVQLGSKSTVAGKPLSDVVSLLEETLNKR